MIVEINGLAVDIPENTTIKDLISLEKEGDPDLIVEHNGIFVYPRTYHEHKLFPGDKIEFINPNLGG